MHNFKKVLLSLITIISLFIIPSIIMFTPFLNSELYYYQDNKLRNSLNGQINLIEVGASLGMCAFDPRILDTEMNCCSYNLSNIGMTSKSRGFFLMKELQRNPIQTVIFDVSFETLTKDETATFANGDYVSFCRLSNMRERISFLGEVVHFDDYLNLYSRLFIPSLEYWLANLTGGVDSAVDANLKGYHEIASNNISLSSKDAKELYQCEMLDTSFRKSNVKLLTEQIKYCQSKGIEVILVVVPRSDADLWKKSNHDVFYEWLKNYSKTNNCTLYDMNLLKNRYQLFNDKESFSDETHMASGAAKTFTKTFCDILKKAETEDVSDLFYSSYTEMKADSPYMKYLN